MLYAYCAFLALKSGHKYLHPPFSHISTYIYLI
nr:MAG TPA: hypothetical protein [Microviridae sp.]